MTVGILCSSPSDLPRVREIEDVLSSFGVRTDLRVLSAHRAPSAVREYAKQARERGLEVLLACSGMAANLAGVVAANTTLPVVGVPLSSERSALGGLDALVSTVQMAPGIPVATVGVDATRNAALLTIRLLAATRPELHEALAPTLAESDETVARYDPPDPEEPTRPRKPKKRKKNRAAKETVKALKRRAAVIAAGDEPAPPKKKRKKTKGD